MKSLSIIVLTYNHRDYIRQNLEGIFMQKVNFPIELIICDDKSADGTDDVIRELLQDTPPHITVKYTAHQKNMGSTPNFYYALDQVTGDLLAFCEGDDYWTDPHKLQLQYDFLTTHPDYSICFHNATNVSPYPELDGTPFSNIEDRDYTREEIYKHWIVHTATVMMTSKTLKTEAFEVTMKKHANLLYFDCILFLAAMTLGKARGLSQNMSAYRRHDLGLSFGHNPRKDLRHNDLDKIIGSYYKGEMLKIANWNIFKRSLLDFNEARTNKNYGLAIKFIPWMFRNKIILYYYQKNRK